MISDLDELPFVYKFDVVTYRLINNPELREHIERIGVSMYEKEQKSEMVCANCRKELMKSATFCIYCGTPVVPLAEQVPFKPGKMYGIIALLCGLEALLAALSYFLTIWLLFVGLLAPSMASPLETFWAIVVMGLCLISPFCAIAGIVFGILGRNTQGRFYAYTGIVLSVLYALLASWVIFFAYNMGVIT